MTHPFPALQERIMKCERCPRLLSHCQEIARVKRRQYRDETYWGRPIRGFGDKSARLWIVGLAPAAHGANRTGRMFTGDSSGDWLYRALHKYGFANQPESHRSDDGMKLFETYISAAARCAPPDNKPTPEELKNCFPYLEEELGLLKKLEIILVLGSIAHKQVQRLLPFKLKPFGHGVITEGEGITVLSSYHPSRQNTQTGRLTREMWDDIFATSRALLKKSAKKSSRG